MCLIPNGELTKDWAISYFPLPNSRDHVILQHIKELTSPFRKTDIDASDVKGLITTLFEKQVCLNYIDNYYIRNI